MIFLDPLQGSDGARCPAQLQSTMKAPAGAQNRYSVGPIELTQQWVYGTVPLAPPGGGPLKPAQSASVWQSAVRLAALRSRTQVLLHEKSPVRMTPQQTAPVTQSSGPSQARVTSPAGQ